MFSYCNKWALQPTVPSLNTWVNIVHYVTYKNVLRADKQQSDFINWLKTYWPIVKKWGAISVKLWNQKERGRQILFCRYAVQNLDRWNNAAMRPAAGDLIQALDEIVELDQISIKITVPLSEQMNWSWFLWSDEQRKDFRYQVKYESV